MLSRAGTLSRPEWVVLELGISLTGDDMWVVQLEIGGGNGQDIGLGKESGGDLESRVSIERRALSMVDIY